MIAAVRHWWRKRRLDSAQALIESYGLTVVKLRHVGTSTYLVDATGAMRRLETPKRKAGA